MRKKYYYYFKGKVTALRHAERNEDGFYNVADVIDWFLSKDSMSPKKLQKLLYYAYSWTLTLQNEDANSLDNKLFNHKFEAWVHGPVVPEIYHDFKGFGYHDIDKRNEKVIFDDEIEDILNQVWEVYGDFTGNQLESITHQEAPWINARDGKNSLERSRTELSDTDIFEYYIQEVEYDD